jgi:hypothetical protein
MHYKRQKLAEAFLAYINEIEAAMKQHVLLCPAHDKQADPLRAAIKTRRREIKCWVNCVKNMT